MHCTDEKKHSSIVLEFNENFYCLLVWLIRIDCIIMELSDKLWNIHTCDHTQSILKGKNMDFTFYYWMDIVFIQHSHK